MGLKAFALTATALTLASSFALAPAAMAQQSTRTAALKSLGVQPADVRHVFGAGLTQGSGRLSKPTPITCTSTPATADYTVGYFAPLRAKGVISVVSQLFKYRSAAGPRCDQAFEIQEWKILGNSGGDRLTTIGGVGQEAFLFSSAPPKVSGPPVYSLTIKLVRGLYRASILVQSGKPIHTVDVVTLGKLVDQRLRKNG